MDLEIERVVLLSKKEIEQIKNDVYTITYDNDIVDIEENIDDKVKGLLKSIYGEKFVFGKKTGNKFIDSAIPSWHGDDNTLKGKGKPDVMVYNFFNDGQLNMIVENKKFSSSQEPLPQAEHYAELLNKQDKPVRVVIGNHPAKDLEVRVLVKDKYVPLVINGKVIKGFIGPFILKMIYANPDKSNFVLEDKNEKKYTQKEFHNTINNLKTVYRQVNEIQNGNDLSINFTVAFIALKMVAEKQGVKWTSLNSVEKIKNYLDKIVGEKADKELKEKYGDIFIIYNDKNKEIFNFKEILNDIDVREYKESGGSGNYESYIDSIHRILSGIPNMDIVDIDLFGEVYECLASKKTKSDLGQYFTRRHIIRAIVSLFFTDGDIEDIVEHKKKIADVACGTGGFLTESFKYIKQYCSENKPDEDLSELASKIMVGYDIESSNIGRTRINMTLAGDGFSDIQTRNTLTSRIVTNKDKTDLNEVFGDIDYILTNVPYGSGGKDSLPVKDVNSSYDFLKTNNNKRLELNFVLKIIEMLKPGGKAAIVVPEGLLEAPSLSEFRKYLLFRCKLTTIISLPKFVFAPYTKWKTYVIYIEKRHKGLYSIEELLNKNEKTWCYIVDNDGYANSDKRFPTKLVDKETNEWLHDDVSDYYDIFNNLKSSKIKVAFDSYGEDSKQVYYNEWNEPIYGKKYGYITINEFLEKRVTSPELIKMNLVLKRLMEALDDGHLSVESLDILRDVATLDKKGSYIIKKENLFEGDCLKSELNSVFEDLNIEYDIDENKWYDLSKMNTVYAIPLIPEKYFRKSENKHISLDEFKNRVNDIEEKLKYLFGGV